MGRLNFELESKQLDRELEQNKLSRKTRTLYGAIFVALIVGIVAVFMLSPPPETRQQGTPELRAKARKVFSSTSDDVNYTLTRVGYDALKYFSSSYTSHLKYAFLADYQAVIEPYQSMELNLYDSDGLTDDSISFEAIVCPTDETEDCQTAQMYYDTITQSTVTSSVSFGCSAYDTFSITIFSVASDGEVLNQVTDSAICLYVRREIRDYTTADLNRYLDVTYLLTNTSYEEGQATYGSNYYDIGSIAKLHFWNAGQRDSDHIHEGSGFLTQHLKLTNLFESSIQAVDPSLTIPYWDFTIDHQSGYNIFDAFVSSPDVFGTVTYPKSSIKGFTRESDKVEDARISDGRWADQKVEMNTDFPTLKSGYGYLRAPWVLNPSPYISRYSFDWDVEFGYLPSCYYNYDILEYTDMMTYFYGISFGPHGTAHTSYGGIFGCDALDEMRTLGYIESEENQQEVCSYMGNMIKEFYRGGYTNPPDNCTVNTDDYTSSECYYSCREDLVQYAAIGLYRTISSYLSTSVKPETVMDYLMTFICSESFSKLFVGDHYESSSMTDPSFWVMHPTIERLTHAKLMSGGFDSETWYSDPTTEFVCAKTACYDEDLDETDYFEDCCYGHYEYDQMFDGFTGTRESYYGATNHNSLSATDPRTSSYSEVYIYDDFSYDHCADSGYDVDELLITQYESYVSNLDSNGKPKQARKKSASEIKAQKEMQAQVDMNRQHVEMSLARKAAKKAHEEKESKKSTSSKQSSNKKQTTKKVRRVLSNSPSQIGK